MPHSHAVVWIDHSSARLFNFSKEEADEKVLRPHNRHEHIHHKAGSIGAGKKEADKEFLHAVGKALEPAKAILIVGPGAAKLELMRHLERHDPAVAEKVVGIDTANHPTDRQIVAYARHYFEGADHLTPQIVRAGP